MKKLLITLAALFIPLAALAGSSDVVLTPEGALYRIESVDVAGMEGVPSDANTALRLTVHTAEGTQALFVPGTIGGGRHFNASLAYDDTTDTLVLFWVRMPNPMSTELLLSSYHQGFWTEPVSIDHAAFHYRTNLRIAITHYGWETAEDGSRQRVPAIGIHAIWWDEDGYGQAARYALISLRDGGVTSIDVHYLTEFVDPLAPVPDPVVLDPDFNRDLFRHPSISVRPSLDGVDLLFADWKTDRFHGIDLEPIHLNGVLTTPIGFRDGITIGPPIRFAATVVSPIQTIRGEPGDIMFFFRGELGNLRFIRYRGGAWTDVKTLAIGDSLSYETAVGALERLMSRN